MKRRFAFLGAILFMAGSVVSAQEVDSSAPQQMSSWEDANQTDVVDYVPAISLDARFGYNRNVSDKTGGFGGDGLYLNIDGKISKNFTYSLCQRLFSSHGEDSSVFDATDWLNLTYEVGSFSFTAGKDVVAVGSYEYDAYDIDSYFDMNSIFYNSFSCYQWGVKAMWSPSDSSSLAFQVTTSPFSYAPLEDNIYAYNLAWYGEWESYTSIWSANLFEYEPGKFVKTLALGNMFYAGNLSLGLDVIMRGEKVKNLGRDITVNFMPSYEFADCIRLFGKAGFERVGEQPYDFWGEYLTVDEMVAANEENTAILPAFAIPNQNYWFYGAGIEYFPLKENKDIRLHAMWASNNYTKRHVVNVGLTWKFDIVSAIKHIARKAK